MNKVRILAPEVISKIAAGEVIERPASVVKELLENSLDAQSTDVSISLQNSGKTAVVIQDNGTGIEPDDMDNLFIRHSTSKLSTIDDLYSIGSFGFRGEALYSIGAVADVVVRSKTPNAQSGWEIHHRGGKTLKKKPVQMNPGTEIHIHELFFNTPARRKFLKTDTTELSQIVSTAIPYALLYPQRSFKLSNNDKIIVDCSSHQGHIERACDVLRLEKQYCLQTKRDFSNLDLQAHMILGDINIQRPKKDLQFIFVNGRPVQNRTFSYQIHQAYRTLFPQDKNPFFILFLSVPPENVDVNIHPTKREVKLKDEYALGQLVRDLCLEALRSSTAKQAPVSHTAEPSTNNHALNGIREQLYAHEREPMQQTETNHTFFTSEAPGIKSEPQVPYGRVPAPALKKVLQQSQYVGCFVKKYLLFETPSSLLLMDQHAAHERVNFEALKNQIEKGRVEVQQLLAPQPINLSPEEMINWEEGKDQLEKIGLSTTLWDKQTIALHSHPTLIKNPEFAVRELLSGETLKRCDVETIARRACRQSIMTGQALTAEEAVELRKQLLNCTDPFTCPHGRPTVVEIQEKQLAKYFLR